MAQKTICDICKRDITEANKTENITYKGVDFQIGMTLDVERCPDADVCRHCTIDAFMAQDDRVKDEPAKSKLAGVLCWQVVHTNLDNTVIAAFLYECDAKRFAESRLAIDYKGLVVRLSNE